MYRCGLLKQAAVQLRRSSPVICNVHCRQFSNEFTIKIPSLGDSISEVSVKELRKGVGENVAVDDAVAVLDSDKVSVDVRSQHSGVVKAWHAKVNDTMKIGADLLTLTLGQGTPGAPVSKPVAASAPSTPPPRSPVPPAPTSPSSTHHAAEHVRVPSIQFRYGGGRGPRPSPTQQQHGTPIAAPSVWSVSSVLLGGPASDNYQPTPAQYRRRPISPEEIEAIELGGAKPYPLPPKKDSTKK